MTHFDDRCREVLAEILDKVWRGKNAEFLREVYRPDAKITGLLPNTELTLDEFTDMVVQFSTIVDVLDWEIVEAFGARDEVHFSRTRLHVRLQATGQSGWFEMDNLMWFIDGKPIRAYMLLDAMTFCESIGALPPGAIFIALGGGTFR